jgi:TonB family protein
MEYPVLARQSKMQGTVKVKCVIGIDGSVKSTEIVESIAATPQQASVRGILGKAAEENARQWKFLKSTGDPNIQVSNSVVLSYVFSLRGETRGRAQTEFVFEAPNTVLITSQAQLWNP